MIFRKLIGQAEASAEELVVAYRERTKHNFHRYAAALGYMDWATQPDPFRRYAGADIVRLPLPKAGRPLPYWQLYADAYRVTGKHSWRRVFEGAITYVLRDLVHPDGGFYASEDADGGAVRARAQPAAHGHACAATHRLGHSSVRNGHEGSMRVQEMTKEAKTRLLCKAAGSITSIDSAIRPRVDNTTAQIQRHAMRSGGSKTHSL